MRATRNTGSSEPERKEFLKAADAASDATGAATAEKYSFRNK
jgi:hypothetical protein